MLTFIFSWFLVEKRTAILESVSDDVQKFWLGWELQVMVLLSLFFQVLLILLGDRRKHIAGNIIGFLIWVAYLTADSVATFALGVLSKTQGHDHTNELRALWAPFLLLHLGGPDTITAYALEDNELWLRHLLQLVIQAVVAAYIIFMSWNWNNITGVSILTIVMFVIGIIKYGERTWALRSASKEQFRDSLLSDPDPGPNYAKFMEGYVSKQDEGFMVHIKSIEEGRLELKAGRDQHYSHSQIDHFISSRSAGRKNDDYEILQKAHHLFQTFKRLFADLILSFRDGEESKKFIQHTEANKAFKVLEIELGFMFDVLYTKAPILYKRRGTFLRSFCFCVTVFALVFFITMVGFNPKKHQYLTVDIVTTYLLLIVAVMLEIYALITLLSSDWVLFWLSNKQNIPSCMFAIVHVVVDKLLPRKIRWSNWSNSMGQNNLISFCIQKEPPKCIKRLLEFCHVQEMIEMFRNSSSVRVPELLKINIFEELRQRTLDSAPNGSSHGVKHESSNGVKYESSHAVKNEVAPNESSHGLKREAAPNESSHGVKRLNASGTNEMLSGAYLKELFDWSIGDVEFHQSILLWHIATDLCYYFDQSPSSTKSSWAWTCCQKKESSARTEPTNRDICKLISDYMLHLLLSRPFLLPEGIGQIRFRDTRAEATELFKGKKPGLTEKDACKILLDVNVDIPPVEVKGDRSKSVLFDACTLAKKLLELPGDERWKMMTNVWVNTLSYAASQCRGANHAKQLSRGGELLTHVWLLMAHLSITQQFQISQGQVRAKLIFE